VASTCSSPLALASGSVAFASRAGSLGAGSSGAGGSEAGIAAVGFGSCLMSLADLMKWNQLSHYTRRAEQDVHYARKDLYLQRRLLSDSFLYS
jgi:hypothetical protein